MAATNGGEFPKRHTSSERGPVPPMLLWVGLGNPEPGMARERHNMGFMALDTIAIRHCFGPWRPRFKGLVAEGRIGSAKILALKPMTYMNVSGQSVQAALSFFKLEPRVLTVFHDELDLTPGKLRVKQGGGAAGHNGLRSIDQMLGTQDYRRVRLGIGHPGHKDRVTGYVLGDFSAADRSWLIPFLDAIADRTPALAENRPEDFMTGVAEDMQRVG
jgi:PTH1 family peptidyl-tRNA hydrolase